MMNGRLWTATCAAIAFGTSIGVLAQDPADFADVTERVREDHHRDRLCGTRSAGIRRDDRHDGRSPQRR